MKQVKILSIVAGCLIIIGLIGTLLTISFAPKSEDISKRIEVSDSFSNISVLNKNAKLKVIPTDMDSSYVTLEGKAKNQDLLDVNVNNNTLEVNLKENFSFGFNWGFHKSLLLTVYLTKKDYQSLHINNSNGKIETHDLQIGNLNIESSNGKIEIKDFIAKKIELSTDNGAVHIKNTEGNIKAESDNGSITIDLANIDRAISMKTSNGAIRLITNEKPTNSRIQAKTDNGRVRIFKENTTFYGSGENIVELETDNGSITVDTNR